MQQIYIFLNWFDNTFERRITFRLTLLQGHSFPPFRLYLLQQYWQEVSWSGRPEMSHRALVSAQIRQRREIAKGFQFYFLLGRRSDERQWSPLHNWRTPWRLWILLNLLCSCQLVDPLAYPLGPVEAWSPWSQILDLDLSWTATKKNTAQMK